MINYFKLYRLDVALIAFFSYLIGSLMAGGYDCFDFLIAGALSLISTNFIYTFNSWADREIDFLNKPGRPLPAGKIKPRNALIYSLFLLLLSCIYPFFVYKNFITLFLFLLLPLLGLLYSGGPFPLRRYPFAATIIISTGLITPLTLGYLMKTSDTSLLRVSAVLFLYCLSIVPLKDIEDMEGDVKSGIENLFARFGKKLLYFSLCGLLLGLLTVFIFGMPYIFKIFLLCFIISSMVLIFFFLILKKDLKYLYQFLIKMLILEALLIYLYLNF